ncbi:MAG: class I SAM-dependent methyltransferase [Tunicatimonas sp.]
MDAETHILASWHQNSEAWTHAVRGDHIESRLLVTNRAIVDEILAYRPQSVLDMGCGEGWLTRIIAAKDIYVLGVDAIPTLITQAQAAGGAHYLVSDYEEIIGGKLRQKGPFEVVVCNFSLFGQTSVELLLRYLPQLLSHSGHLIIQTIHPAVASLNHPYCDGWRAGSWSGFSQEFVNPAPWYFRTVSSWVRLLQNSGFALANLREPIHPQTQQPASLILVGTPIARRS